MKLIRSVVLATVLSAALMLSATAQEKGSLLRHVVCLKFKSDAKPEAIKEVEDAFRALKAKIPAIAALEWGKNNSPEGLNKGFTHCFTLTFKTEDDRKTYLPHPDHKKFGAVLKPVLDDVFVIDYWSAE